MTGSLGSTRRKGHDDAKRGDRANAPIGGRRAERPRGAAWPDVGIVLGVLMAGVVMLGHVLLATVVSVIFLRWLAVLGRFAGIVASLFHLGKLALGQRGSARSPRVDIAFLRRLGLTRLPHAAARGTGTVDRRGGPDRGIRERHGSIIVNGVITPVLGRLIVDGWPDAVGAEGPYSRRSPRRG